MRTYAEQDGMTRRRWSRGLRLDEGGFSLAELVMVCALLGILATIAMPVAKFTHKRVQENDLRHHLRTMRNAIDEHKRYSDAGLLPLELGSDGYPKDLEVLVEGIEVVGQIDRKMRFLRKIPVDPFTGEAEWALRSYQDEPDSDSWDGENVYDVHSTSGRIGLNGIPYSEW